MAEYAAPYSICDTAVGYIDGGIAVDIAVSKGISPCGTKSPEGVCDGPVSDVYHFVIVDIAEQCYAELGLGLGRIAVIITGNGNFNRKGLA